MWLCFFLRSPFHCWRASTTANKKGWGEVDICGARDETQGLTIEVWIVYLFIYLFRQYWVLNPGPYTVWQSLYHHSVNPFYVDYFWDNVLLYYGSGLDCCPICMLPRVWGDRYAPSPLPFSWSGSLLNVLPKLTSNCDPSNLYLLSN
jgi:hypothetical protein